MQLFQVIQEFLIASKADSLADDTLRWYASILKTFSDWMKEDQELEAITTKDIRLYIIRCQGQYSADGAHAHIRVQHRFWKWCHIEYGIVNPMRNIKYPSPPVQEVPKAATNEDIARIFSRIKNEPIDIRNRALLAMLIDTGARATGLCTLTMANLDMERHRIVVTEKGRKARQIAFTTFTAQFVEDWLKIRANVQPVFYNVRDMTALTRSGLEQILKKMKEDAGVNGRANPHALRHAFAREYLLNGGDLATLSRNLGHKNLETTVRYYAVFTETELQSQHIEFSPMSKLMESLDKKKGGG